MKDLIHPDFSNQLDRFKESVIVIKRSIARTLQELRADIMDKLDQHGLTKDELQRKRSIFDRAKELYQKYIRDPLIKAREVTNTFLDVADVILDSLVMVVPVAGAAKEVKGTIKAVIVGITYRGRIKGEPTSSKRKQQ